MNNKNKPKNFKKSLKRLLSLLFKYKFRLFLVVLFAVLSTVFVIASPKILGNITTEIFEGLVRKVTNTGGINFTRIGKISLILGGIYLFSCVITILQGTLMSKVCDSILYDLRKKASEKINKIPMKYFDTKTHGEILSIISNDIDLLSYSAAESLVTIITGITTIIGIIVMMFSIDITMTFASFLIVPLCMAVLFLVVKKSQRFFQLQQKYLGHMNGHVEEIYGGHDIVKAFNGEDMTIEEFKKLNNTLYDSAWKSQFLSTALFPVNQFIGNLGYVVIAILGGFKVIHNKIQVGEIQSFTQYVRSFTQQINQLSQVMGSIQSAVAASERVFEFLDLEEEEVTKNPVSIKGINGNIEFKNVHFGYNPDKIIINDFSCKVKEGQKIAIVGPTGAGKSTIIKLLMRFYELNSGEILIDGVNLKDFDRGEIRKLFGMVLQDTWLFNGTVKDNIRYGKLDATLEEVREACKTASVDHFITTLEEGYDMILNEEADNISGGEKQLLTIARVILADPKILILDEATSSVDTRTEILIQNAMDKLMENRTSFIIAHRLSTIKNADIILVLKDGDIVEQGNHEELLKKKGFYSELYNSQFEVEDV